MDVLRSFAIDFFNGAFDSFYGFYFITRLDAEDEPEQAAAPAPGPVRTVLSERRAAARRQRELQEGENPRPERPAEPIVRRRVKAWKRVLQCVALNGLCVVMFYVFLLPFFSLLSRGLVFLLPEWVSTGAGTVLPALSILPFFIFSRIVNALWFSDIANACLRSMRLPPPTPRNPIELISDFVVSILLELVFLLQSSLASHVPIPMIAPVVYFVHLSLLYSLYSFEYFWMARNRGLKERIGYVERRWPYFVGFGAPLTVMTATLTGDNILLSGCAFGALFPFFIVSSCKANWRPDRGAPATAPSPPSLIPPIRIFMPSQMVTNWLSAMASEYFLARQPHFRQQQR